MKLRQYLAESAQKMTKAGVDSPRLCAHVLVRQVLGLDRIACVTQADRELTSRELTALDVLVARRAAGEPLAHITGSREFYGRDFLVTPHTLIPRPETELLVEKALEAATKLESGGRLTERGLYFADVGTGSGCIGITLALELPRWRGLLMDISGEAVNTARQNARMLGAQDRVVCIEGDLYKPPLMPGAYALLASNPPYVAEDERPMVMPEVLAHEPHGALFSPAAGLAHLGAVIGAAARALAPGGCLLLEHGAAQGAETRRLLRAHSLFEAPVTHRDMAGLERCTVAFRAR